MSDIEIIPVRDRSDWKAFLEVPHRIYRDDPHHVAELAQVVKDELDRGKNPISAACEWQAFVARRDDVTVARAVAICNPEIDRVRGERTGMIGYFECIDDPAVARATLDACEAWCRERGAREILLGIHFSLNYQTGIQISGFDEPHTFLMPHHPRYYEALIASAGFTVAKRLHAYCVRVDRERPVPDGVQQRARALRDGGFTTRSMTKAELESCMRDYNETWRSNYLHTPLSDAELAHMKKDMGLFVDLDFCLVAEHQGKLAGYLFTFPDFNLTIRAWQGKVGLTQILSLLWRHKVRRQIRQLKTAIIGVRPEYRGQGVSDLLNATLVERAAVRGCETIERSWILEDNLASIRQAQRLGGALYKTYAVFSRPVPEQQRSRVVA
jgi:GNAT superfamily N-acetyltransferase